jgi:hypothetical protein
MPVQIKIDNKQIKPSKVINVTGVLFHSNLKWSDHATQQIKIK